MNKEDRQEKVAVVTGSSSGIGFETSLLAFKKWILYLCNYEKFK